MGLVCATLALLVAACDEDPVCTLDEDGDGFGEGCEADCDDGDPLHHADCLTCSDPDGDGYGLGCDPGLDCDSADGRHWADCGVCVDDGDGDGAATGCDLGEDCDPSDPNVWAACDGCTDGDGDGSFVGCDAYTTVAGPDCDDDDPDSFLICGFCRDDDGDGYFTACDAYADSQGPDCDDDDPNAWDTCGACRDGDGDGYFAGCNAFETVEQDCDDGSALHWADCGTCVDGDTDGYGPGCDFGTDCDNADEDNWSSCATCNDGDGDGYYDGCDAYATNPGPDCDDTEINHWSDCGTCTDGDGDGRGTGICDLGGGDCDDANPDRFPGNPDPTIDGTDQNCDQFDMAALFTDNFDDGSFPSHWSTIGLPGTDANVACCSTYTSAFYAANFGGSNGFAESTAFNTSACTSVRWQAQVKRGPSAPSAVEPLLLQYWNGGAWITAFTYPGNSLTDPTFTPLSGSIAAPEARRAGFRVRWITTSGTSGLDDFFVDDVAIGCGPDVDADGTSNPFDCAPADADHWSDCGGACVDTDGDDFGPGCNLGVDTCGPGNAAINPRATDDTVDGTDQDCDGHDGPITTGTYEASPALAITDSGVSASGCASASAVSNAIVVADVGTIFDVDVSVTLTHARASDLDVWLRYDNGTVQQCIQLATDAPIITPTSPDTLASFTSAVFSDEASIAIDASTVAAGVPAPPFTATFRPETGTPLSLVDGLTNATTWTLYVNDDQIGTAGTLTSWRVTSRYF